MLSNPGCSLLSAPCPSCCCQEPVQEPHQAPVRAVPSPAHDIREPGGEQDKVVSLWWYLQSICHPHPQFIFGAR